MEIFGLKCSHCSGDLETLNVINGTIHTQCKVCGFTARPSPKQLRNNQVFSRFANKTVEVAYNRPKANPPVSKSGTFERTHFESSGLRKCK